MSNKSEREGQGDGRIKLIPDPKVPGLYTVEFPEGPVHISDEVAELILKHAGSELNRRVLICIIKNINGDDWEPPQAEE